MWFMLAKSTCGRATDVAMPEAARQQQRIRVTPDADFHTHLAVTNAETPSIIRLRTEGLKAEAFAQLLIDVWPQIHHHVESGASMIAIYDRNIRVRRLPIAPQPNQNYSAM
jgi:predicted nuclease of predicted toxin-antitoxin system